MADQGSADLLPDEFEKVVLAGTLTDDMFARFGRKRIPRSDLPDGHLAKVLNLSSVKLRQAFAEQTISIVRTQNSKYEGVFDRACEDDAYDEPLTEEDKAELIAMWEYSTDEDDQMMSFPCAVTFEYADTEEGGWLLRYRIGQGLHPGVARKWVNQRAYMGAFMKTASEIAVEMGLDSEDAQQLISAQPDIMPAGGGFFTEDGFNPGVGQD